MKLLKWIIRVPFLLVGLIVICLASPLIVLDLFSRQWWSRTWDWIWAD